MRSCNQKETCLLHYSTPFKLFPHRANLCGEVCLSFLPRRPQVGPVFCHLWLGSGSNCISTSHSVKLIAHGLSCFHAVTAGRVPPHSNVWQPKPSAGKAFPLHLSCAEQASSSPAGRCGTEMVLARLTVRRTYKRNPYYLVPSLPRVCILYACFPLLTCERLGLAPPAMSKQPQHNFFACAYCPGRSWMHTCSFVPARRRHMPHVEDHTMFAHDSSNIGPVNCHSPSLLESGLSLGNWRSLASILLTELAIPVSDAQVANG